MFTSATDETVAQARTGNWRFRCAPPSLRASYSGVTNRATGPLRHAMRRGNQNRTPSTIRYQAKDWPGCRTRWAIDGGPRYLPPPRSKHGAYRSNRRPCRSLPTNGCRNRSSAPVRSTGVCRASTLAWVSTGDTGPLMVARKFWGIERHTQLRGNSWVTMRRAIPARSHRPSGETSWESAYSTRAR